MSQSPEGFDRAKALAELETAANQKLVSPGAVANIRAWLTEPRYAEYAPQVAEHIEQGKWKVLDDVFWTVIPFGTGGRRGKMYPIGSNAINDRTIGESAQGLADYVKRVHSPAPLSCAIAYDTRHQSRHFAELCAEVMAAAGFSVYFLDGYRSTPELSFAVRHNYCSCGIMVTASHNPPSDNAVKAYWSTGGQLLPPHDQGVIDCVMSTTTIERISFSAGLAKGQIEMCQEELDRAYIEAVHAQGFAGPRELKIIYSPLHGVGASAAVPALTADGFEDVEVYGPHSDPNGDFPNVPGHISNPENSAVFDAIIERGIQIKADLILATDPDCDRIGLAAPLTTLSVRGYVTPDEKMRAVAKEHGLDLIDLNEVVIPSSILKLVPESVARENTILPMAEDDDALKLIVSDPLDLDTFEKLRFILNRKVEIALAPRGNILEAINRNYGKNPDGHWATMTGNQIGALLTDYVLDRRKAAGRIRPDHYIVKTLVTTELIRRIADAYGVITYGNLQVGFKYIGGIIDDMGPEKFIFGAEESYGFLAGTYARDKDAAVAAMLLAELAARVKAAGQSLHQKLDALYWQYGYHGESQISVAMPGSLGMQQMAALMAKFRNEPPRQLAGLQVTLVRDYLGLTEHRPGQPKRPLDGPRGDMVMLELAAEGTYVAVRPSGTEPKVKYYMFTFEPAEMLADLEVSKAEHAARLADMGRDLTTFSRAFG
jgi:phosphomannomutase